jgi:hypothetical protein
MEGGKPRSAVWLKQNCGVRRGAEAGCDMAGGGDGAIGGGGGPVDQK